MTMMTMRTESSRRATVEALRLLTHYVEGGHVQTQADQGVASARCEGVGRAADGGVLQNTGRQAHYGS